MKVYQDSAAVLEDNQLADNAIAIAVDSDKARLEGNQIVGSDIGVQTYDSPTLEGNVIRDGRVGLSMHGPDSKLTLVGNTICDNEQNVFVGILAEAQTFDDSNEICEDDRVE